MQCEKVMVSVHFGALGTCCLRFLALEEKNYAIKMLNFLLQHDYILSEIQAAKLI